jgi:hypothetical protein
LGDCERANRQMKRELFAEASVRLAATLHTIASVPLSAQGRAGPAPKAMPVRRRNARVRTALAVAPHMLGGESPTWWRRTSASRERLPGGATGSDPAGQPTQANLVRQLLGMASPHTTHGLGRAWTSRPLGEGRPRACDEMPRPARAPPGPPPRTQRGGERGPLAALCPPTTLMGTLMDTLRQQRRADRSFPFPGGRRLVYPVGNRLP